MRASRAGELSSGIGHSSLTNRACDSTSAGVRGVDCIAGIGDRVFYEVLRAGALRRSVAVRAAGHAVICELVAGATARVAVWRAFSALDVVTGRALEARNVRRVSLTTEAVIRAFSAGNSSCYKSIDTLYWRVPVDALSAQSLTDNRVEVAVAAAITAFLAGKCGGVDWNVDVW